ncbi:MAG: hypothetical protein ACOYEV_06210 [Candidatus Nanopelagicales bacterium]
MNALITTALTVFAGLTERLRAGVSARGTDAGASTLELVIIILGLVTVAGILVAALTTAVRSRVDQLQ